ncbi:hypothetical protein GGI12_005659 [Dipsacomyces acuminosporus]|nr:hypothetical protein GGI12_005659 [Dipsacomyces acuminosporus]
MRAKRAKAFKKGMAFYQHTFGFREPYQILLGPDFILEAAERKISIIDELGQAVQGKAKFLATWCTIDEVRKSGDSSEAVKVARSCEKRRCPHKDPISGTECIKEIMGDENKFNYCVAVQDKDLRDRLRRIPGVPLIHIQRSVVLLEHVQDSSKEINKQQIQEKLGVTKAERMLLKSIKKKEIEAKLEKRAHTKKHGPKGPNPLSVKKPKRHTPAQTAQEPKPKDQSARNTAESAKTDEQAASSRTSSSKRPRSGAEGAAVSDTKAPADGETKHKRKRKRTHKKKDKPQESTSA